MGQTHNMAIRKFERPNEPVHSLSVAVQKHPFFTYKIRTLGSESQERGSLSAVSPAGH
jgi:hypothetical protein